MLDKLAIGTANFHKPYGILNRGATVALEEIEAIFEYMLDRSINTIDTAFVYGDLFSMLSEQIYLSDIRIVTKFSVLDNYADLYNKIEKLYSTYKLQSIYGLLVHDPQNLSKIDSAHLKTFLDSVRSSGLVSKTGISAYDMHEVKIFQELMPTDLVQIPLNPLNQRFNCNEFKDFVLENNIEVHARSLFLQGILLATQLPESLQTLGPIWQRFQTITSSYSSRLHVLLSWALNQNWVSKWIIGISSLTDLEQIISQAQICDQIDSTGLFEEFKGMPHLLTDPRNWTI